MANVLGLVEVSFPLTPALSPAERENCFQLVAKPRLAAARLLQNFKHAFNGCSLSAGERVRVRGRLAHFLAGLVIPNRIGEPQQQVRVGKKSGHQS